MIFKAKLSGLVKKIRVVAKGEVIRKGYFKFQPAYNELEVQKSEFTADEIKGMIQAGAFTLVQKIGDVVPDKSGVIYIEALPA